VASHPSRLPDHVDGPRIALRRWRPDDVHVLARSVERNHHHLEPWMPWMSEEPLADERRSRLIDTWEENWSNGGDAVYGVFLQGEVVGGCGLHRRLGPSGLEIGYWVDHERVRCGIGTEIGRMLTSAAFTVVGIDFTEIHHDKANLHSGRIPQRLGYVFTGESADQVSAPGDVGIDCAWRMDIEAWRRSHAD
jgi:RimJ/RimL family protein N-acetyltransferase